MMKHILITALLFAPPASQLEAALIVIADFEFESLKSISAGN